MHWVGNGLLCQTAAVAPQLSSGPSPPPPPQEATGPSDAPWPDISLGGRSGIPFGGETPSVSTAIKNGPELSLRF